MDKEAKVLFPGDIIEDNKVLSTLLQEKSCDLFLLEISTNSTYMLKEQEKNQTESDQQQRVKSRVLQGKIRPNKRTSAMVPKTQAIEQNNSLIANIRHSQAEIIQTNQFSQNQAFEKNQMQNESQTALLGPGFRNAGQVDQISKKQRTFSQVQRVKSAEQFRSQGRRGTTTSRLNPRKYRPKTSNTMSMEQQCEKDISKFTQIPIFRPLLISRQTNKSRSPSKANLEINDKKQIQNENKAWQEFIEATYEFYPNVLENNAQKNELYMEMGIPLNQAIQINQSASQKKQQQTIQNSQKNLFANQRKNSKTVDLSLESFGTRPSSSSVIVNSSRRKSKLNNIKQQTFQNNILSFKQLQVTQILKHARNGMIQFASFTYDPTYLVIIKSYNKALIRGQKREQQFLMLSKLRQEIQQTLSTFFPKRLDAFQDIDCFYYVEQFIQGGDLLSKIRSAKRFELSTAIFFLAEVIYVLDKLHSLNIIYRDLKPENILLDLEGHIQLVDFDSSTKLEDNQKQFFMQSKNTMRFSLLYSSRNYKRTRI